MYPLKEMEIISNLTRDLTGIKFITLIQACMMLN